MRGRRQTVGCLKSPRESVSSSSEPARFGQRILPSLQSSLWIQIEHRALMGDKRAFRHARVIGHLRVPHPLEEARAAAERQDRDELAQADVRAALLAEAEA
jgi:hypothetical protein